MCREPGKLKDGLSTARQVAHTIRQMYQQTQLQFLLLLLPLVVVVPPRIGSFLCLFGMMIMSRFVCWRASFPLAADRRFIGIGSRLYFPFTFQVSG